MWSKFIRFLARKLPALDRDIFFWKKPASSDLKKEHGTLASNTPMMQPLSTENTQASITTKSEYSKSPSNTSAQQIEALPPSSPPSDQNSNSATREKEAHQEQKSVEKQSEINAEFKIALRPLTIKNKEVQILVSHSPEAFNIWRKASKNSFFCIKDMDLSETDLKKTNWSNCILINVSFEAADLQEACFDKAILRNVDFTNANTMDCDFSNVDLNNTQGLSYLKVLAYEGRYNRWLTNHWPSTIIKPKSEHTENNKDIQLQLKVLKLCKKPLKKREIAKQIGLKYNSKRFKQLHTDLLKEKLLCLTIPDKPTSSLQQYYTSDKGISFYHSQSAQASTI